MSDRLPTYKQLEKDLSLKIKALYDLEINFAPRKVTCKLFSRYLAIVIDEALSPLEKSLLDRGKKELIARLREETFIIFQAKLSEIIEEMVGVQTIEILTDTAFGSNKTGTLVVLSESPKVRSSKALPNFTVEQTN